MNQHNVNHIVTLNKHIFQYLDDAGKVLGVLHVVYTTNYSKKINYDYYHDRAIAAWSHVNALHRRKGIATQLYLHAAKYFNQLGYKLYSSDNMSHYSKILWSKLQKKYPEKVFISDKKYYREHMFDEIGGEEELEELKTYYIFE